MSVAAAGLKGCPRAARGIWREATAIVRPGSPDGSVIALERSLRIWRVNPNSKDLRPTGERQLGEPGLGPAPATTGELSLLAKSLEK
jgi:hypothetical protein